jgi:glycosyl transferase family 2
MKLIFDAERRYVLSNPFGNELLLSGYASPDLADARDGRVRLHGEDMGETEVDVRDVLIFRSTRPPSPSLPLRFHLRVHLPPFPSAGRGRLEFLARTGAGTHGERIPAPLEWDVMTDLPVEEFGQGERSRGDAVCVVVSTFNPTEALFAAQIRSIRAQTLQSHCVVIDDGSEPDQLSMIRRVAAASGNATLVRTPRNKGFPANFETGLAWAYTRRRPRFIALADQDDAWRPEKLATLADELERSGRTLAFSDVRLTDADGRVLSDTFWLYRKLCLSPRALAIANFVPGMACLFRAALIPRSLPFPALPGLCYHDHWLARCADQAGGIVYHARPLGDYVQHPGNHTGAGEDRAVRPSLIVTHYVRSLLSAVVPARLRTEAMRTSAAAIAEAVESELPRVTMMVRAGRRRPGEDTAARADGHVRRVARRALLAGFRDGYTRGLSLRALLLARRFEARLVRADGLRGHDAR